MKLYDLSHLNKVYVLSDISNDYQNFTMRIQRSSTPFKYDGTVPVQKLIEQLKKTIKDNRTMLNDSVIIVNGNCYLGFHTMDYYQPIFEALNNHLLQINSHVFFVRGNHDDPSYFSEEKINLSNIKSIPDYSVIKIASSNILCIGGSVSIDRSWRKMKEKHIIKVDDKDIFKIYWENEMPIYSQEELQTLVDNNISIDYVISHTVPSCISVPPQDGEEGWYESDAELCNDLKIERYILQKVYDFLIANNMPIKKWIFGHFNHNYHFTSMDNVIFVGINNGINFRMINCCDDNDKKVNEYSYPRPTLGANFRNAIQHNPIREENPIAVDDLIADYELPQEFNLEHERAEDYALDEPIEVNAGGTTAAERVQGRIAEPNLGNFDFPLHWNELENVGNTIVANGGR